MLKYFRGAVLAMAFPAAAQAALPPAGTSYSLKITTSFEAPFTDCWSFSSNGRFVYSPNLHYFHYQLDDLNTQAGNWQAIWLGHVSLAFSGVTNGSNISGNAVDSLARTYSITGTEVGSCAHAPKVRNGWPTGALVGKSFVAER
jgi:hypothetical protein